ncbi:MAG: FHA domain-containing protein [Mogibacterium sp.]|nr:FHA domain-containing protein [Mogibacterium sp.]
MALEKYKVCPNCGEHNSPGLLECRRCETDLTGVAVVDEDGERLLRAAEPAEPAPLPGLARVCDCGEINPPQARKCRACGEDISDILPTAVSTAGCREEAEASACGNVYTLQAIPDGQVFRIGQPVCVLGREAALREYLADRTYVSRVHAKLTAADGAVWLENLSSTNRTYINNVLVERPVQLLEGDEIGLGGVVADGKRQDNAAYLIFHRES